MSSQFWDDRYRADEYAYGREPNGFLRAEAHRIPRGHVLCLAEGEGRNAHVKITTVHADLSNYEPEADSLTGIVAIFAHLPPEVRKRVHAWIPRALRPEGVFILEAYTPKQLAFNTGGPRNPDLLMTLAELRDELAPLTIEIGREVERQIDEGSFHAGASATVQVVAVRQKPRCVS